MYVHDRGHLPCLRRLHMLHLEDLGALQGCVHVAVNLSAVASRVVPLVSWSSPRSRLRASARPANLTFSSLYVLRNMDALRMKDSA